MADTTTPHRPAWLILAVALALAAVVLIAANLVLGDTGNDTRTDPLVDTLCDTTPDC